MVKNLIKMLLCAIIFIATSILAYSSSKTTEMTNAQDTACNLKQLNHQIDDSIINLMRYSTDFKKDSLRNLMIDEVQDFIDSNAPRAHKDIATLLVDNGLANNVDIAFMMAQTQYETNFGTAGAGRASARHSLFGVKGKYSNYSNAVTKYVQLLKKSYLTKGRTEKDLMHKFTTSSGARYCSNPNYEATLRKYYRGVTDASNIRSIQKQYEDLVM